MTKAVHLSWLKVSKTVYRERVIYLRLCLGIAKDAILLLIHTQSWNALIVWWLLLLWVQLLACDHQICIVVITSSLLSISGNVHLGLACILVLSLVWISNDSLAKNWLACVTALGCHSVVVCLLIFVSHEFLQSFWAIIVALLKYFLNLLYTLWNWMFDLHCCLEVGTISWACPFLLARTSHLWGSMRCHHCFSCFRKHSAHLACGSALPRESSSWYRHCHSGLTSEIFGCWSSAAGS